MKTLLKAACAAAIITAACIQAASAAPMVYTVNLTGPNESPPNASPGGGFALVTIDPIANTMEINLNFSGLLGNTTASHIHCCTATAFTGTAGVATVVPAFPGFPLGVTSGSVDSLLDMSQSSSWNGSYITANGGSPLSAEAAFFAGIAAGKAYLNIHTTVVPGGEIRGFLVAEIPEPATISLFGLGAAGLGFLRRRRRTQGRDRTR